jgi:hypothetical protein
MEILKIIHTIEDQIIECDRTAARSSSDYAEKCKERGSDLWKIKMKLRDVLDYGSKRIAVE